MEKPAVFTISGHESVIFISFAETGDDPVRSTWRIFEGQGWMLSMCTMCTAYGVQCTVYVRSAVHP